MRRSNAQASYVITAMLAAAMVLSGCSGGPAAPPQPAAVPVLVAIAERRDVPVELSNIGNVEASSSVSVRAQVGGNLTGVHFKQGDPVREGQVLFTIDPLPYQAALDEATANLARDRAMAKKADADVARYEELAKRDKDYVTQQQLDQVFAEADSARQTVKSDEAALERARIQLGYCTISSPIAGRAGDLLVHPGNLIKANDENPLVVLLRTRPVFVTFSVPERYLSDIRKAAAVHALDVQAAPPSSSASPHRGALSFVDNTVNTTTGTIQLKATFPNEDESLWPGQFVQVTLTLGTQAGAVVVPAQAIQTGQSGSYVFVVKQDGTVESRPVTVARTYNEGAIVDTGISPGDTVVTDGQLRLVPGVKVEVKSGTETAGGARS